MTIRITEYMGEVFYDASTGKTYQKLPNQPTEGAATVSPGPDDERNYSGKSFEVDNVAPYQSSWSAGERCVIEHTPEYMVQIDPTEEDVGTHVYFFTAPSDGELRVYIGDHTHSSNEMCTIWINGTKVQNVANTNDSLKYARCVRLQSGDIVDIGINPDDRFLTSSVYGRFRPDTYP